MYIIYTYINRELIEQPILSFPFWLICTVTPALASLTYSWASTIDTSIFYVSTSLILPYFPPNPV